MIISESQLSGGWVASVAGRLDHLFRQLLAETLEFPWGERLAAEGAAMGRMHGGWESPENNEKSALAASHTHWWFVGLMMFNGNFAEFCFFNLGPQTSLHYSCTMVHACRHREILDFGVPNVREAPLSMIPLPDIIYQYISQYIILIYIYILKWVYSHSN